MITGELVDRKLQHHFNYYKVFFTASLTSLAFYLMAHSLVINYQRNGYTDSLHNTSIEQLTFISRDVSNTYSTMPVIKIPTLLLSVIIHALIHFPVDMPCRYEKILQYLRHYCSMDSKIMKSPLVKVSFLIFEQQILPVRLILDQISLLSRCYQFKHQIQFHPQAYGIVISCAMQV